MTKIWSERRSKHKQLSSPNSKPQRPGCFSECPWPPDTFLLVEIHADKLHQ